MTNTNGPIRIAYGAAPDQFGQLHLPAREGPHPLLIVIHGGRWQASSSLQGIRAASASLAEHGLAVWSIEYRRLGIPGGGWPGTWQDVAAAADHVRALASEHPINLDRVSALGHSAGGPLSLWLGGRQRLSRESELWVENPLEVVGVISSAGVNDFRAAYARNMGEGVLNELLGGAPDAHPVRYASVSPPDLLPFGIPQLLIHGLADTMVNVSVSQDYERQVQAAGDPVRLVTIPGADHFQIRDPATVYWAPAMAAILDFCGVGSADPVAGAH